MIKTKNYKIDLLKLSNFIVWTTLVIVLILATIQLKVN